MTYGTATIVLHSSGTGEFRPTGLSFIVDDIGVACVAVVHGGRTNHSDPEDRRKEGIYFAELTDPECNGYLMSQNRK